MKLTAPEPINADHDIESFSCGVESLDHWLKNKALKNQQTGASRTFVVCEGKRVVAYLRVLRAAEVIGIRGVLVHALSAEAQAFYKNIGFDPSPLDSMTLMVTLADIRKGVVEGH